MSKWKKEYEGFPFGFLLWFWEQHRVSFVIGNTLLLVSIAAIVAGVLCLLYL